MKIAVVGANSNIARNFIWQNKGKAEFVLYDYQEEHFDNLNNYIKLDLSDKQSIEQFDCNVDLIYYFVGATGNLTDLEKTKESINVNQIYLVNFLVKLQKEQFGGKFIFPSTRLVYKGKDIPLIEDSEKEMKTSYGISKFACEKLIEMFGLLSSLNYVIVRICVPYSTLIKSAKSYGTMEFFFSKAMKGEDITIYGDGRQKRTFIHMEDLVNILFLCGTNSKIRNDIYNIGGQACSLYEAAQIVAKKTNVNVINIEWPKESLLIETGSTVFNSDKLDNIIKYSYKHSIQEWVYGEPNL